MLGIKEQYRLEHSTVYVLLTTLKPFETDLIKLTFHIPTKNMPTSFDTHGHFPNEFHCTLTVGNIDKSIIRMYRKYHIQVVSNTVQYSIAIQYNNAVHITAQHKIVQCR